MGRGPRLCGRLLVTAAQLLLFDRGEGLDCVAAYHCTVVNFLIGASEGLSFSAQYANLLTVYLLTSNYNVLAGGAQDGPPPEGRAPPLDTL